MIKLELTLEEVNMILRVLGRHPFDEVVTLVGKIRDQGQPQVNEQADKAKSEEEAKKAE